MHNNHSFCRDMARNKILISICLMLLSLTTMAEIGQPRNNLCIGANAGIAMNTVDFDPTIKQKQHLGPTVGLSMKYTSEKYFTTYCALYCELNYTKLGWKEDFLATSRLIQPRHQLYPTAYIRTPCLGQGKQRAAIFLSSRSTVWFLHWRIGKAKYPMDTR